MMRPLCILAVVTTVALTATAQPGPPPHHGPPPAAMQGALLLDLAAQVGLDEAQTVKLYQGFRAAEARLEGLRAAKTAARNALEEALAANAADAAIGPLMDALRKADMELSQAKQAMALETASGLSPAQQAKIYLLLSTPPGHGNQQGPGAPPPPPGAPAAAPAPPAPAPELSTEEQALNLVKNWVVAAKAKDLAAMIAPVSEKFTNPTYGDKAGLTAFVQQGIDMGYFDDIEVSLEDAEIEVDQATGKASIYPVDVTGTFGSVTVEFIAHQEEGVWKLIGLDISGI